MQVELIRKQLPKRSIRGIPRPNYEPSLSSKVKYPMNNYVSTHNLSESNKAFINQLSYVVIPNNEQEAHADPRWKTAINEEIESLKKKCNMRVCRLPIREETSKVSLGVHCQI